MYSYLKQNHVVVPLVFLLGLGVSVLGCQEAVPEVEKVIETQDRVSYLRRLGDHELGVVMDGYGDGCSIWDVRDQPRRVREYQEEAPIFRALFPISATLLARTMSQGRGQPRLLQFVDISEGQVLQSHTVPAGEGVRAIAADTRGEAVAWVEQQVYDAKTFRLKVVDVKTGTVTCDVRAPLLAPGYQEVECLAFSPDGETVAFGSSTGKPGVGLVDLKAQEVLWHQVPQPRGGVWRIAFHPDSESFYTSDSRGQLSRYATRSGELLWRATVEVPGRSPWGAQAMERLLALDVSPDGKYVAVGTDYSQTILMWDIASGERVARIGRFETPVESALVFSADSKGIWAAGSQDRRVRYFPLPDK